MTQTPTAADGIRSASAALHLARQAANAARGIVDTARQLWEEEYAVWIVHAKETADLRDIAERQLRELAVQVFQDSGDKHPGPGVSIRLVIHLSYDDRQALEWGKKNDMAIALDKRSFESIAKAERLPFVRITEEPKATIAQDLEKALAEGVEKENHE